MNFVCPACGKTLKRDMRVKASKNNLMKRGYKSYCIKKGKDVFCKREGSLRDRKA